MNDSSLEVREGTAHHVPGHRPLRKGAPMAGAVSARAVQGGWY